MSTAARSGSIEYHCCPLDEVHYFVFERGFCGRLCSRALGFAAPLDIVNFDQRFGGDSRSLSRPLAHRSPAKSSGQAETETSRRSQDPRDCRSHPTQPTWGQRTAALFMGLQTLALVPCPGCDGFEQLVTRAGLGVMWKSRNCVFNHECTQEIRKRSSQWTRTS